jgi:phage shock protein A
MSNGLLKKLRNMFRQQVDKVDKSLADTARDGKYAIEDANKEIAVFTEQISNIRKEILLMEKKLKAAESNVEKMSRIAEKAVDSGNDADASSALTQKNLSMKEVIEYKRQVEKSNAIYQQLLKDRKARQAKIDRAQMNMSTLSARQSAAKMRESAAKVRAGFEGSDALSALDELEESVEKDEASAEAFEEIAGMDNSSEDLEEKYSIDTSVEDELAALKQARDASRNTGTPL